MTLAIETPRSRTALNLALLLALATLWGAAFTLIKIGVATIPPITLIAGRTLIAGIILLAIMNLRGIAMPRDLTVWRRFMIQACLNSAIPFILIAWAEQHVDAGLATILGSNSPIFAFLLALLFVRHERPTLRQSPQGLPEFALWSASMRSMGLGGTSSHNWRWFSPVCCTARRRCSGATSRGSIRWCRRRDR